MYLIFRCDCGRVLSANEYNKTRKCTCGKTLTVKNRRVLAKVENSKDVPVIVQEFQDAIYKSTGFITANKIKSNEREGFL